MSNSFEHDAMGSHATPSLNLNKITGMATALVVLNIVLMLALAYTPVSSIARLLFSNFFIGIATFVITVGGGFWVANKGIQSRSFPLAGVGVTLIQAGYGLFGATILTSFAQSGLWIPALAITAVITGLITAVVAPSSSSRPTTPSPTGRSTRGASSSAGSLSVRPATSSARCSCWSPACCSSSASSST